MKSAMVYVTLSDVARPYGPKNSPASYVRDLFLRLLKAIHGKQPLAQLIALELSTDHLICPVFAERLLSVALGSAKVVPNPDRALDLVLAMLLDRLSWKARPPPRARLSRCRIAFPLE